MRALVVTTVHQADDPRIRDRTIGSLSEDFEVTFASKLPGPTSLEGIEWVGLTGGRVRRWWKAWRLMMSRRFDVVSLHDPELIPAALIARIFGRRLAFDLHENVPVQVRHKAWIPALLRPPIAWLARVFLRLADRFLAISLAEDGYASLFRKEHVVFPNHARRGALPPPGDPDGSIVYVGDVTEARGATTMVEAAALLEPRRPLVVVGRCPASRAQRLTLQAESAGVDLTLTGNLPHRAAMSRVATASVALSLLHGAPNERDSMPTKVVEYLQMGVPVVASDLPGTRSAVEGLQGVVLVEPADAAAAASGVAEALGMSREALREQATELRVTRVWPDEAVRSWYRSLAAR